MASFSNELYNAARYAAARPLYPRQLFTLIYKFHDNGKFDLEGQQNVMPVSRLAKPELEPSKPGGYETAIDLGCGTGQATVEAAFTFDRVFGLDPSEQMITKGRAYVITKAKEAKAVRLKTTFEERIAWIHGAAERFVFPDESVDLFISGQAAHWFNWNALWPHLARMVKPGGTVAFWGYSQLRIRDHPELTPLINEYAKGTSREKSLGPFWEQPGRDILDRLFVDIPRPSQVLQGDANVFGTPHEVYYTNEEIPQSSNKEGSKIWIRPPIMRMKWNWESFGEYLRTWSALDEYWIANPSDKENKDGDIVVRFMNQLKNKAREAENPFDESAEVNVEWPLVLQMFRKL